MPGWLGWFIAGISTAGFVFLWFWEVLRVLRSFRSTVESAAEQLTAYHRRLMRSRQDAALQEVLRRSESIYRQAVEQYNTALCKPWAYLPGRLLGFRKEPVDILIPPAA